LLLRLLRLTEAEERAVLLGLLLGCSAKEGALRLIGLLCWSTKQGPRCSRLLVCAHITEESAALLLLGLGGRSSEESPALLGLRLIRRCAEKSAGRSWCRWGLLVSSAGSRRYVTHTTKQR
jgi:hypothetical protein